MLIEHLSQSKASCKQFPLFPSNKINICSLDTAGIIHSLIYHLDSFLALYAVLAKNVQYRHMSPYVA